MLGFGDCDFKVYAAAFGVIVQSFFEGTSILCSSAHVDSLGL